MRQAKPALAAFLLLSLAAPAFAQNLVRNADFDTNVDFWTAMPGWPGGAGSIAWSPLDWAGNPNSGSALLTNAVSGAGATAIRVSNCITVPTTGSYEVGGHIRIPGGQASTGQASVLPVIWDLPGCVCCFVGTINLPGMTVTTATTDVWVPVLFQGIQLGAGSYVQLTLRVTKDQAGGTLASHFDFARFGLQGTTPVRLLEFEIE